MSEGPSEPDQPQVSASEQTQAAASGTRSHALKWIIAALLIAGAAYGGWRYWQYTQHYVSTDDAYVHADAVKVAAQVSGRVARVFIENNEHVRAGQALFEIDPESFSIDVAKAKAQLALARQAQAEAQANVAAARAGVEQRSVELHNADTTWARYKRLVKEHSVSQQAADDAAAKARAAAAALADARAQLAQARAAAGTTADSSPRVRAAKAALAAARLNLARTHIDAPTGGVISQFKLRPGSMVRTGSPLFVLIADHHWIDANFKETELGRIHRGQLAQISVDMYPNHVFHGVVQSVSGASGTAFSLLPPQNATGNWVKVTQRVPVRIRVLHPDPRYPLRVGTTASVTIRVAP